jgi:hypothetical protein
MEVNILKILQGVSSARAEYIKRQTRSRDWPMYAMICSEQQYTPELLQEYDANFVADISKFSMSPATLCFRRAVRLVTNGAPFLIIDNNNLHTVDISPYVYLAEAYGYAYTIVHVDTPEATGEVQETSDIRKVLKTFKNPTGWYRTSVLVKPELLL